MREDYVETLAPVLLKGIGIESLSSTGRGPVGRFPVNRGRGILRRYRRGGMMRFVMKDRYFAVNRAIHEMQVHAYLYQQGFPVPEPLGAWWERRGLWFRGGFATREIESISLLEYVAGAPTNPGHYLQEAGTVIRTMHDLGVYHKDLQLANILLTEDGVFVIDLDRAQCRGKLTASQRARNLLRLRRSFDRNFVPLRFFEPLLEGYGSLAIPGWMDRVYRVKGWVSDGLFRW